MVHVLAIITAKPGQRDRLLQSFQGHRAGRACRSRLYQYGTVVDVDGADPAFGPDTFVVVEESGKAWRH